MFAFSAGFKFSLVRFSMKQCEAWPSAAQNPRQRIFKFLDIEALAYPFVGVLPGGVVSLAKGPFLGNLEWFVLFFPKGTFRPCEQLIRFG